MTVALAFVALMRTRFTPHSWVLATVLVLAWGAINALLLTNSVRRNIHQLETATASIAEHPVAIAEQPFHDFDGLAYAISVVSTRVENLLAQSAASRDELAAMVDSMQDAVLALDAAGRIQWANQHMKRLLAQAAFTSVRVGHALVQTIRDPDTLDCVRTALQERVVTERRTTTLLPGHIFEVSASPMPGGGAVAVLHDITRIEQVERTQRDFVANVSHELRTPLTSITGYVETLLDHEQSLSPVAREFLGTILKNATRMNRLTEDLLVMTRVESSGQQLNIVPVAASLLVRDSVQAMSGLVQDTNASLETGELADDLVLADPDAIVQVLSNLIENAIKYGKPRNQQHARVVVSARRLAEPEPAVEFRVQDFGQGIASEHLDRIFERFYRVDKARSRESGGTGLGLAIAQHTVQIHGGTIHAESELNAGSTFVFTLPLAPENRV
ncbi:MAG: PAS-domain containing protein [Acidobacteriota bacterium]|nr:PAS-domain containing protein [Acidobacteriota bacterium]